MEVGLMSDSQLSSSAAESGNGVLFRPNPFRGSIQSDAWSAGSQIDVTSIHAGPFQTCCEAVEWVRTGQSSAGIVIHGEAGSGKTHLISRLRRRFTDLTANPVLENIGQAFAYVQLNTHFSSLARHTRRCVAIDLMRTNGKGPSQLERLVIARLMTVAEGDGDLNRWWEYTLEERAGELDDLLFELGQVDNLSPMFLQIVGHLIRRRHRLQVAAWLRGEPLTDQAYELLQVAPPNPDEHPEDHSRDVLLNLMRLAGPKVPLVLCFDQIEALQVTLTDPQPFFEFSQLLVNLHDADNNLVLISCMQTGVADQLRAGIPAYSRDRMQSYATCMLPPLDIAQGRELLSVRMGTPGRIAPFTDKDLAGLMGPLGLCTPRMLLDRASSRYDELSALPKVGFTVSLDEWLSQEWAQHEEKSLVSNDVATAGDVLRHGLPLFVQVIDPVWQTTKPVEANGRATDVVDYVLVGPQNEARVAVKICEGDATRLCQQLKKLNDLLPDRLRVEKVVLLRDERAPISKGAKKTHEMLAQLEKKDVVFSRVSPEAMSALDALRTLLSVSKSGDLDFAGKAVGPETVVEWLRKHLAVSLQELAETLTTQQVGEPVKGEIDRLQEYLNTHQLAGLPAAAEATGLTAEEIVDLARSHNDLLQVISGNPGVVFSVRSSSAGVGSVS
jgi:hypothetical protein